MASRKVLIQEYCNNLNGTYKEGGFGQGPMMIISHNHYEIVFDYHVVNRGNSSATYTRVRSVFKNNKDYTLKVAKQGFIAKIGKAFGGQDIEIGDEIFDEEYVVKSNDELLTTKLLNEFDVKSRLNFRKNFHFDVVHKNMMGIKCVDGESGLYFSMIGKLRHEVEVINLIELFKFTLDKLVDLQIIDESLPGTQLYKEKKQ